MGFWIDNLYTFSPFMSLHVSFLSCISFLFFVDWRTQFCQFVQSIWIEELVFRSFWMLDQRQWPNKFIIMYSTFEMFLIFILLYFILIQFLFPNLQKYKSQSFISLTCLTVHSSQIHRWMLLFIFSLSLSFHFYYEIIYTRLLRAYSGKEKSYLYRPCTMVQRAYSCHYWYVIINGYVFVYCVLISMRVASGRDNKIFLIVLFGKLLMFLLAFHFLFPNKFLDIFHSNVGAREL